MPVSAPFPDSPALAARYLDESRSLLAARLRVACWLGVALVPAFVALDATLHPHLVRTFLEMRLVMLAGSALVLLALRTTAGLRHVVALSLVAFCEIGAGVIVMTTFNGGGSSPYHAGINLVMLAAAVLMPWEPMVSALCCGLLVGGYAVASMAWAGVPDVRVFTGNLFFLNSTAVITIVSHVVAARARRREFLQRIALEEAGRHREQFLANVSHELRTPLAAIFGYTEMLADFMPNLNPDERGWLARIAENAGALYRLIVQLLDFSNLEAGTLTITRQSLRIDPIIEKVATELRGTAECARADISVEVAPETRAAIGDPERVESVVASLLTNAVKFAGGQPVVVRIGPATLAGEHGWDRIVPETGPDVATRRYTQVAIVDCGDGIERDDLRRLFVGFQQLDGSSTRRHGGTGIGLALSARLAAAMQGHIAVRSRPGAGSTFALLLPAADDPSAEADTGRDAPRVAAANG